MVKINYGVIYDSAFNLLDVSLEDFEYVRTIILDDGLYIDFDSDGRPAAIEMIDASKKFQLLSSQLEGAKIEGTIKISEDEIKLEMKIPERNRILEKETPNTYNIPSAVFEFAIDCDEM